MKKLAIIAMALMVALAVTACSNNTQNSSSSTPEQSSSQTEQSSSEEESSSEAEEVSGDLDENISQPPTGAEDEPEEEISSDKVTPEE